MCFTLLVIISESELLTMVQAVSEDKELNTIEFNEFLIVMSNYQKKEIKKQDIIEAAR